VEEIEDRVIFHRLIPPEEALERLKVYVPLKPLSVEEVPLEKALGRVLAEDIVAKVDIPPFDRSTVDGYAVYSLDVAGAREDRPVELKVVGKIEAGEAKILKISRGECVEVATGAPLPQGANAVVMVEYTKRIEDKLLVYRPVSPGENVSYTASDVMVGEVIAYKGTQLTPQIIGALATAGYKRVKVYVKPKVAIISTGNELIEPGQRISYGKIYDTNSYMLYAAVLEDLGEPYIIGIIPDKPKLIEDTLRKAINKYDVILTSGSTSAGPGDVMYKILDKLGKPGVIVHGLNIKPGKPTVIAAVNGKPVFGLPGYPVSCLMNYNLIVKPVIRALAGLKGEEKATVKATLAMRAHSAMGKRTYIPVALLRRPDGKWSAFPIGGTSETIVRLTRSDGYIVIPENIQLLEENSEVTVYLFTRSRIGAELEFIGSHCPMVEKLLENVRAVYDVRMLNVGSTGGLLALRRGEGDIAGVHLLDAESGTYNKPFIEKFKLENVVLVKGYYREQGIIVAKGNPYKVKSLEDILDKKLKFINRNKGSGTRVLIDMIFEDIARKRNVSLKELVDSIDGYYLEAKTHSAVASAIKYGKADVGVGLKYIAKLYDLDFIPLTYEEYDFIVVKDALKKDAVKRFIETLKSEWFIEMLKSSDGYKPKDDIGEIEYL